ncbi:MAG: hypothetical protein J6A04_04210 [Clostridia bacterium]|nr:hypothetical protein [Clostridia bacterium]
MPENKILKEFLESTYNKEKNYNSICSKIKGGMNMKKKLLNIAAVLLIIVVAGVTVQGVYAKIAWNIEYEKYQNRNVITRTVAIDETKQGDFAENINMDYIYQDGIGIKVKSLMLTNDYCKIGIDFKLNEEAQKNKDKISYGYAIYDENNNIYAISERISFARKPKKATYFEKLYKELGIKSNNLNNELCNSITYGFSGISMTSDMRFPKSKKLYVRIFDIGYETYEFDNENHKIKNSEEFCLSNSEWQFEIDVPEKFYERTAVELVLSENVEGIVINKAELTETSLVMKANIKGLRDFIMDGKDMKTETFGKLRDAAFYISDGNDNIYLPTEMGTTREENEISARFGIGKDALENKIFLNVSLNDIQAKIELIQK